MNLSLGPGPVIGIATLQFAIKTLLDNTCIEYYA